MHFVHPSFLFIAFALGLALVALFARLATARRRALARLGATHLLPQLTASVSPARRRLKEAMTVVGVALIGVALARPQLGYREEEARARGVDVLFAVDTSKSMLTPDVKPDRLTRAKLAVHDLVETFPGDRVGLVAFAGSAFLETPLTLDHAIFEQSLDGLDTSVIPLGGTNVAAAIDVATKALSDDAHEKVLVLLTDGEDLSGEALAAAERGAKAGLVIHTVGVGTPAGELVPLPPKGGHPAFVRDDTGRLVTSRLDEPLLRRIAAATGGSYHALGDDGQGLLSLYRNELAKLPRSDLSARTRRVPVERFQWPLGLGLALLSLEPLVGERRRARRRRRTAKTASRARTLAARAVPATAAGLALCLIAPPASASPQSGERAYRDGRFVEAQTDYAGAAKAKPADARLDFNLGAAAYRNGDLDTATRAFQDAIHTDDLKVQQRGYYNLGDALYRGGERTLAAGKKEETIATWKQAVADYEAALHLNAADADATYNRDFVKGRIAELEKQQPPQDEPKSSPKSGDQKKNESRDGRGGQGSNGGKSGGANAQPSKSDGDRGDTNADKRGDKDTGGKPQGASPRAPSSSGARPDKGDSTPKGTPPSPQAGRGAASGPLQPNTTPPSGPSGEHADDRVESRAGELSKSEARALLDSLRGDLEVKPHASAPPDPSADPPTKDW